MDRIEGTQSTSKERFKSNSSVPNSACTVLIAMFWTTSSLLLRPLVLLKNAPEGQEKKFLSVRTSDLVMTTAQCDNRIFWVIRNVPCRMLHVRVTYWPLPHVALLFNHGMHLLACKLSCKAVSTRCLKSTVSRTGLLRSALSVILTTV